jgi:hypothetical protein
MEERRMGGGRADSGEAEPASTMKTEGRRKITSRVGVTPIVVTQP